MRFFILVTVLSFCLALKTTKKLVDWPKNTGRVNVVTALVRTEHAVNYSVEFLWRMGGRMAVAKPHVGPIVVTGLNPDFASIIMEVDVVTLLAST